MRYALTFTLWILGTFLLIGQEVDIRLHQEIFYGAHASIILVSTDDGAIVHKLALERELATQDINFQVDRTDSTQKLHLTVLNEYELSYMGMPYFRALTKYDIPDEYELEDAAFINPIPNTIPNAKMVRIYLSGVKKVNDVLASGNSATTDYRFKRRKKKMAFNYLHVPGWDLYILLKCNDEAHYRYIYLPDAEVKQRLYLHYESLPDDLTHHTLDFPFPYDSKVWMTATNDTSKNWTFLKYRFDSETNKIGVYMPEDIPFHDFKANIKPVDSQYFPYSITAHEWPKLTTLISQAPPALEAKIHPMGFTFDGELGSNADVFLVDYWLEHQEPNKVPNHEATARHSFWYVQGKPAKHIDFVLPEIPPHYYDDLLLSHPVEAIGKPKIYLTHQYPEGRIQQGVGIRE